MNKEELLAQLGILLSLPYTTAYTGSLDQLRQGSYVEYSEVIKAIKKIREQLKEI